MTDKPEAVRYRKAATITATQWWQNGDHSAVVPYHDEGNPTSLGWVNTLEGGHIVTPGDWIATGVKGEHWPIKPDVFAATYAPDTPTPSQPDASALVEVLRKIDKQVSHAMLGDWHIALNEIRTITRAALTAWEQSNG